MNRPRILFVCTKRGARSQIAAAFLRRLAGDACEVAAACFEDGKIPSLIWEIAAEAGIPLIDGPCKSVFQRKKDREPYDYVITLCSGAGTELCPVFAVNVETLYRQEATVIQWDVPDFQNLSPNEVRDIVKLIRETVEAFGSALLKGQLTQAP
jgi:protein-tyrosine-phosphatase